jgi:hypothetical protein
MIYSRKCSSGLTRTESNPPLPMKLSSAATFVIVPLLFLGPIFLASNVIPPDKGGIIIAAMSSFSALSTAFGFQILSLRREVRRTDGVDEERRTILRRRLDRTSPIFFRRWGLSFSCGITGAAIGLVVRESYSGIEECFLMSAGFSACLLSVFFLYLLIEEYRSLLQFATDLEDRSSEIKKNRQWAEKTGKVEKK